MSTLSGDLYSKSLRITQHVNVIIPDESEDFWTKIDDGVRVLYLLHGLGSNSNEWTRFSMIEAYAKIYGFAVIMPDGNRSFYENVTYGPHYLDWISQELPDLIHTWFRLPSDRNHTFIAGESMGGFGALRIALENPDRYGGAVALPSDSVVTKGDKPYLYVVKEDETVEQREITLGQSVDGIVQVLSGIKEGERVVVEGGQVLSNGTKVRDLSNAARGEK